MENVFKKRRKIDVISGCCGEALCAQNINDLREQKQRLTNVSTTVNACTIH